MLYVLRLQIKKDGFFKVGISINPAKRMPDIQTNCPAKLALVSLRDGGRKEEKDFHKLLKPYQTSGEWFKDTPETRAILAITAPILQEMKKSFLTDCDWFKVAIFLNGNKAHSYDAEMLCSCLDVDLSRLQAHYHNKKYDAPFRLEGLCDEDAAKVNLIGKRGPKKLVLSHPELFTPILGDYDEFWQGRTRITPFNIQFYPGKKLGQTTSRPPTYSQG